MSNLPALLVVFQT